jgi:hypothetical protein
MPICLRLSPLQHALILSRLFPPAKSFPSRCGRGRQRSWENSGSGALVEREGLVARRPAALAHQLLHVVAHLVEPREPDTALGAHIVEKFEDRLKPRKAGRQCRMPDRDLQRAELPGRVELDAEDLHRPLRRGDRNSSSEALPSRKA